MVGGFGRNISKISHESLVKDNSAGALIRMLSSSSSGAETLAYRLERIYRKTGEPLSLLSGGPAPVVGEGGDKINGERKDDDLWPTR